MRTIRLGRNGPQVSQFGLGCMGMAGGYGPADDKESIATIRAALEAGVTFLDAADFYGMGGVELLLREALKGGRREQAYICIKAGALRDPKLNYIGDDIRPKAMKNFLAYSLQRLGTDYIDMYQPTRITGEVPIEDTIGALAEMVQAGHIRHIGLSEASPESIRRASAVHPIAALQIEYSLMSRGIEKEILPTIRELGIALVAYGVLSRGLISDSARQSRGTGEIRGRMPRFQGDNFTRNLALVEALAAVAREKGATTAQLAFAWVAAQGDDIVPLIGARRRDQLAEGIAAAGLKLSADDLARIEDAMPAEAVAGARYAPPVLAHLDSERAH